jgi:hypothetical protein
MQCCIDCGKAGASHGPCPFAAEIYDDETPVWLCDDCRYERAMDI